MYLTMYDATSPGLFPVIDQNATDVALAAYCDGDYAADWIGCVHKYPVLSTRQRILSIGNKASTIARLLDYEPHNPIYGDPAALAQWVVDMVRHGIYRPGAYADRSDMPAIQDAMVRTKLLREQFVLWLAAPGADPTPYLNEGFDAVQTEWFRNYDVSVVKPEFFPPLHPTPPAPELTEGVLKFSGELDTKTGQWNIHGDPSHGIKWGTRKEWWMAELGVYNQNGHWSIKGLPFRTEK